ncbi:MAG: protelomerase family protein, partial [Gloeobacterales cyanobacterium]
MDASLLKQAATQAKTGWLEQALTDLLPQVWDLTTQSSGWEAIALEWAAQIDDLFEQKKLTTPGQQKNRRTDIANALRTIDPNHPVIPFVLLSSEVYTQLNNEQANRLNARENKFFSTQQADELVERAIKLLDSDEPDDVAAGLAVLVGRRISEILISEFKPKTAYSLLFSEAVKRRGEVGMEFEIPTLAPAERVLGAINHLKHVWNIEDLKALDLPDNHLKRRINARYSGVPHACRQHFADLVPGREAENDDGERLYTHLFRAVYAEIATYYYKPDWVPDHRFKAEIQGHFKLSDDGEKIPNYSARQNYDDYRLRDRTSGLPGVKLDMPRVEVLEVFQKGEAVEDKRVSSRMLETGTINALIYRAVDQLLFSNHWAEAATGLVLVTGRAIQTLMEKSVEEKSGFSIVVDGLEVPTLTGASQVVSAWKKWQQLEPLPEVQIDAAVREVCELTFGDLLTLQSVSDLRAVYGAIATHWFCPPETEAEAFLKAIRASETAGFMTANGVQ